MAAASLPTTAGSSTGRIDLAGVWQLVCADGGVRTTIDLPGDVHSALQAAGLIADPYVGRNERDVQWVAETDWTFSRSFTLSDAEGDWYLDLDYVDTVATVSVNGTVVLNADNCFRRYRPSVGGQLRAGDNEVSITIHSAVAEGARRQAAQPFPVPHLEANSPIPNGNMLRKPQCHFGWDWNIAIAPLGLYGRLALCRLDGARIEHVTTRQFHGEDGRVDLIVDVSLHALHPGIASLSLDFAGETVHLDCATDAGETIVSHRFSVENPRLWWPAGQGEQALYRLKVRCGSETIEKAIGLRSVELDLTPDAAGSRFAFRINGREIFAKGANWIPADALFSRTSPAATRALLQSAVDANMNMIRVWGGGFYEFDDFYAACDELGLMVWQDCMFACNLYPSTPDFLANVSAEIDYQARRLSSHASIVLWCGDNELVGALNWFEVSRKNRDRYLVSYDRLNRTIETALRAAAPDAIWWPSSPAAGFLDYGDAWHADGAGDMHFWSVWHENQSFDHYRSVRPRFCSEFGFQSYPSMPLVRGFAEHKDLNIASPVMEHHQKNKGGNERIAATMFRSFRFPKDFAGFVYLSQVQQGLAIKTAVDFWRAQKPHCMGTLYWQLNDTWPVASWASLDHGGGWKALHYMARRFYQPVQVMALPDAAGEKLELHLVNDLPQAVTVDLAIDALTLAGERRPLAAMRGMAPSLGARMIHTLALSALPQDGVIALGFTASDGSTGADHVALVPYKALELLPSGVAIRSQTVNEIGIDLVVAADGLALFVMLEADRPGRFSDNLFDLAAGEERLIRFTPADRSGPPPRFTLYDLQSCQAVG